jgi:hypothetical protein
MEAGGPRCCVTPYYGRSAPPKNGMKVSVILRVAKAVIQPLGLPGRTWNRRQFDVPNRLRYNSTVAGRADSSGRFTIVLPAGAVLP